MLYLTYHSKRHQDGAGAQLLRIISAYLVSVYYSVGYYHTPLSSISNYGLLCLEEKKEDKEQIERYNQLFCLISTTSIHEFDEIIEMDSVDDSIICSLKERASNKNILLQITYPIFLINSNPSILNVSSELQSLSSFSWLERKEVKTKCIKVGVHIRRGDILLIEKEIRYLPNEYYINIMRNLMIYFKEASIPYEFHIYTENVTKEIHFTNEYRSDLKGVQTTLQPDTYEDFNEIDNIVWHINTNPIDSFVDLCNTDLLLISISAFSYLAGILNRKAIVFYPLKSHHPPHSSWIVMDSVNKLENNKGRIVLHCNERLVKTDLPPITYCSGGALGDFIHQLSIIKEIYDKTGRKGILYISHQARASDFFPFGLDQAYKDTYEMITSQSYIDSYYVHCGESCDINLSSWVCNQPLYLSNWGSIFLNEYGVPWCTSPYLTFPNETKFKNHVFISSSIKRFNHHIDYKNLVSKLPTIPVFVTSVKSEYEYFKMHSGIDLECVYFDNLYDLHKAIYNCKLFIGNLSSPLTIAQACFKPRICIMLPDYNANDNKHMRDLDTVWGNCLYVYNSNDSQKIQDFIERII
jgi:hypothetical protein